MLTWQSPCQNESLPATTGPTRCWMRTGHHSGHRYPNKMPGRVARENQAKDGIHQVHDLQGVCVFKIVNMFVALYLL